VRVVKIEDGPRFLTQRPGEKDVEALVLRQSHVAKIVSEILIPISSYPASTLDLTPTSLILKRQPDMLLPLVFVNPLGVALIESQHDVPHPEQEADDYLKALVVRAAQALLKARGLEEEDL